MSTRGWPDAATRGYPQHSGPAMAFLERPCPSYYTKFVVWVGAAINAPPGIAEVNLGDRRQVDPSGSVCWRTPVRSLISPRGLGLGGSMAIPDATTKIRRRGSLGTVSARPEMEGISMGAGDWAGDSMLPFPIRCYLVARLDCSRWAARSCLGR